MQYRPLGKIGVSVSFLGLGGHEYHADGRLRGFSDDLDAAVRPGYTNPDFASPDRRRLVAHAVAMGVNYFDATIDPEVAALRTCLPPAALDRALIQCRPQAMCYRYDAGNRGLADLSRLRAEVERLLRLLGRDRIDVLNFGIESDAESADGAYFEKIATNIRALKEAGSIRFAACDTLSSGTNQYLRMMRAGCFDVVWLNFGPMSPSPAKEIFPLARELGMGVVAREAFQKGNLFRAAEALPNAPSRPRLAAAAIRWVLSHPEVSALVVGVRNVEEFDQNLAAAGSAFNEEDREILRQVM